MDTANLFSYCVGGLALVSSIVSVVIFYRSYLPGVQIRLLDDVLQETKQIFQATEADGLFPTPVFQLTVQEQLTKYIFRYSH
jgi:hypothetical protein